MCITFEVHCRSVGPVHRNMRLQKERRCVVIQRFFKMSCPVRLPSLLSFYLCLCLCLCCCLCLVPFSPSSLHTPFLTVLFCVSPFPNNAPTLPLLLPALV